MLQPLRLAALAALLALASVGSIAADAPADDDRPLRPRYALMDAKGRPVTNETFPEQFQLISFGYTFCPDVCPTTLAEVADVMKQLGPLAERVQPVFITVDPARDTPVNLQQYADFFDPRIIGLSGSPALVAKVAQNYKVRYEIVREPNAAPDAYTVDHSAGLYVLAPGGSFVKKFAYGAPVSQIVDDLRQLIEQAPAPRP
ncbi:SCO family protein [Denitromonas ohlonensis]|jgi:protein SCO1/2|uniref:SCO family protein n=2 Tax=Denitromonas TaxID=139331 RepID=A0A558E436_9RHOO|nr:SCO family protein [Denitromonas ohlonensis]TVT50909.1 MAG: SCO family protein [Denitromonas halophila]TVO67175.1 SCO family protein [Denitromonas ohlonensis]TVO79235.1 SCO family protein [Denitromonas ohlonensis]TVT68111.1 MAG: SCO family protein [Denitromonas halophila]TVT76278.1 MAG: SCO family protein [Denitromonas halophila]